MFRFKNKRFQFRRPANMSSSKEAANENGSREPTPSTERLGASDEAKKLPRPTILQLIDQKMSENEQLRGELEYERKRYQASRHARLYIAAEASRVVETLREALENFEELTREIEKGEKARNGPFAPA